MSEPGRKSSLPPLLFLFVCLCCAVWVHNAAEAALAPKGGQSTLAEATNPKPDANDLLLPMPCNASMAFKAAGVQADGFLWDMETLFGCDNCDRQGRDYYERRYPVALSGPFSAQDVPEDWRAKLPKAEAGDFYFYFIGKYELSNFQWKAVMEGWCPTETSPLTSDDAKPKTGASWFEAVEFARRYTNWLLANAPDSLPRFAKDGKNVGYLRLPTEAEWEYAARGGHAAPKASLRESDFFPMREGGSHADYAVFRSQTAGQAPEKPQNIGSRMPNPLGLYDTAGNAAEMVQDSFRFSLGGRLHGSSGGFIRKGGSFFSGLSEILPGRREEAAYFLREGENRSSDMGFRLALSGINTPAGNRPETLAKEWRKAGEASPPLFAGGANPLEELDRLIAAAVNPQEKENLARLRGIIKDKNIALERQQAAAAEGLIRASLFMVETARNYGVRHKGLVDIVAEYKKDLLKIKKEKKVGPKLVQEVEESLKQWERNRQEMEQSLLAAVDFYRSKVEESLSYPEQMFADKLKLMGAEIKGEDLLARNMRKAHQLYAGHVEALRKGRRAALDRERLVKDILPLNLQEGLERF